MTLLDYLGIRDAAFANTPGRSFSAILQGEPAEGNEAVFFEQEETRGVRTARFSYWKRLETTGEPELYDMVKDPGQHANVHGHPEYADIAAELEAEADPFFRPLFRPAV